MSEIKPSGKIICQTLSQGEKLWTLNGEWHREDGPAWEAPDGAKTWWIHNKRHREDGPAIIYADGRQEWWYHDKRINCSSQQEFEKLIKLKAFW